MTPPGVRSDEREFREKLARGADPSQYREVLDLVAGAMLPIRVQIEVLRKSGLPRTTQEEKALSAIIAATSKVEDLIREVRRL